MSDLKLCSSFFLTMTLVILGGALGGMLAFVTRGKKRFKVEVAPSPTISINVIDRQWISVKDRLPPENEAVLTHRDGYPTYLVDYMAYCDGLKWMRTEADQQSKITHWKKIEGPY